MLLNFSVSNYLSFKDTQTFNLLKDSADINNLDESSVHNSSLIFGANSSGKSNLISAIGISKKIVLTSNTELEKNFLEEIIPFLLDSNSKNFPAKFEYIILYKNQIYRYNFSVIKKDAVLKEDLKAEILYEELFISSISDPQIEVLLFKRNGNTIKEIDKDKFKEAKNFYNEFNDELLQTRPNVPFISVLAGSGGEHSSNIISWFKNLNILSGLEDEEFIDYSLDLYENNKEFYAWVGQFMPSLQIERLEFQETFESISSDAEDLKNILSNKLPAEQLNEEEQKKVNVLSKFLDFIHAVGEVEDDNEIRRKNVKVVKIINGENFTLPFSLESSGTKKLIALLGPIFDSIENGKVLVCDEIDSKLHTLFIKHLFKVFHNEPKNSQLIATAHDVNLIDKDIFNKDQIWFINKDEFGESDLYSLVEFKELSDNTDYKYNYLHGAYNAIPLFNTKEEIMDLME